MRLSLPGFWTRLKDWEKGFAKSYEQPILTQADRKRALFFTDWIDHGILRYRWHNFARVADGVYRSNHPNAARMADYAALGIKSVLNLRGGRLVPASQLSNQAAANLGLEVFTVGLSARQAPAADKMLELMEAMRRLPKPMLLHCKSGADRTGLAAALYLLVILGRPMAEAKAQLSLRFLHVRWSKTGVLDRFLDAYGAAYQASGIGFEEWLKTEYDPARID